MHIFPVLIEVLISLVVLYILFSIINALVVEAFARWLKTRAKFLKNTMLRMLDSSDKAKSELSAAVSFAPMLLRESKKKTTTTFTEAIYSHRLMQKLAVFDKGQISSIDRGLFADILISLITNDQGISSKADLMSKLQAYGNMSAELKEIIKQVIQQIDDTKGDIFGQFRGHISRWYAFYMDKATESYKNHIRKFLFIGGLILAFFLNLDTIYLAQWFYENPDARTTYVRLGEQLARDSIAIDESALSAFLVMHKDSLDGNMLLKYVLTHSHAAADSLVQFTAVSPLPLGPGKFRDANTATIGMTRSFLWKVLGILITAFALSFGSPFWFDVLKKLIGFREELKTRQSNG